MRCGEKKAPHLSGARVSQRVTNRPSSLGVRMRTSPDISMSTVFCMLRPRIWQPFFRNTNTTCGVKNAFLSGYLGLERLWDAKLEKAETTATWLRLKMLQEQHLADGVERRQLTTVRGNEGKCQNTWLGWQIDDQSWHETEPKKGSLMMWKCFPGPPQGGGRIHEHCQ